MSFLDKNRPLARPPGGQMWTEDTIGLLEELEIEYGEGIYKLYDDVACSPVLCQKILQWTGHVARMDDRPITHNSKERMFRRKEAHWEGLEVSGRLLLRGMP